VKKIIVLIAIFYAVNNSYIAAQRIFTLQSDSIRRSYLVNVPKDKTDHLPLIIILHDNYIRPLALDNLPWHRLRQPAVILLPIGLLHRWYCSPSGDSVKADQDQKFLWQVILQTQHAFNTDPSSVFIIGMGEAHCVAEGFVKRYPGIVRAVTRWNYGKEQMRNQYITSGSVHTLDSIIQYNPPQAASTIPVSTAPPANKHPKLYKQHVSLGITLGRWQQAERSRTEFDDETFIDIAKHHFIFGFTIDYNFTEKISTYADVHCILIPKEKTIHSITIGPGGVQASGSGHGGIVIPYAAGIRYAFLFGSLRPFITAAAGYTYIHVEGGTGSGSSQGGIKKDIVRKIENIFTYHIGTGVDYRFSPGTSLRFSASYTLSNKIDPPAGSINYYQGASILTGLAFILAK
jgi:hypothetical protein